MKEYLRSLAIAHYVVGGVRAFGSCFGLIYCVMGIFLAMTPGSSLSSGSAGHGELPPVWIGWILASVGGLFTLVGWTLAGLTIYSGRCLSRRERRNFSIVIAAINCIFFPYGSAMGILTLMMLTKDEAKALYSQEAALPPIPSGEIMSSPAGHDIPPGSIP